MLTLTNSSLLLPTNPSNKSHILKENDVKDYLFVATIS